MNGGSFQDVSTWTISNKMIFFFFIMTIDIGATSSMMFMTNPGYLICGICIAFFALILQLWFFFLVWKTIPCQNGMCGRLCFGDFRVLPFIPLYLGVLSIEIFKLNLVSIFPFLTVFRETAGAEEAINSSTKSTGNHCGSCCSLYA